MCMTGCQMKQDHAFHSISKKFHYSDFFATEKPLGYLMAGYCSYAVSVCMCVARICVSKVLSRSSIDKQSDVNIIYTNYTKTNEPEREREKKRRKKAIPVDTHSVFESLSFFILSDNLLRPISDSI